jgi:hypothetical protein
MSFFDQNNICYNPQSTFVQQNNFYSAPAQDPTQLQSAAYTQGCEDMQTSMLEKENQDLKAQLASQQQSQHKNKQMFNIGSSQGGGGGGGLLGGMLPGL